MPKKSVFKKEELSSPSIQHQSRDFSLDNQKLQGNEKSINESHTTLKNHSILKDNVISNKNIHSYQRVPSMLNMVSRNNSQEMTTFKLQTEVVDPISRLDGRLPHIKQSILIQSVGGSESFPYLNNVLRKKSQPSIQ